MTARTEQMVRFAGFGGQGIVKAGEIFGAAAVADGKLALQNQSYGSSARGVNRRTRNSGAWRSTLELTPCSGSPAAPRPAPPCG